MAAFEGLLNRAKLLDEALTGTLELLDIVSRRSDEVSEQVVRGAGSIAESAASAGRSATTYGEVGRTIKETIKTAESDLRGFEKRVDTSKETVDKILESMKSSAGNKIEQLLESVRRFDTDWNDVIEAALQAVLDGGLKFQDFLKEFGDFVIEIEGKTQTFREFLQGIDTSQFEKKIKDLGKLLKTETLNMEEIFKVLANNQSKAAKDLLAVLRMLQAGENVADDLAKALQAAKDFFPGDGDVLDDVVKQIEEQLRDSGNR